MHTYPREIPVLVIGAGPTGLTVANLLASQGVSVLVVDRNSAPLNIPRAIVLDDEGMRTFQAFGLRDNYGPGTITATGSHYCNDDGSPFAITGAGATTYGFPKRTFINQPELETVLRSHAATAGIKLRFSSEVTGMVQDQEGVRVTLRGSDGAEHQIRTDYVAACDGGRSPTRESLGITMAGSTYSQDWIVIDTRNDPDTSKNSRFYCSSERPAVSVPAPNGGRRYEFMLMPGETHAEVMAPEKIRKLMSKFRALDEADIVRKTVYTFHARIADRFRDGRILLLGDAAHLTPPFAGQGMNAGLRDASNVAWKLAAVVRGEGDEAILDSYFDERRDPAWAMIQLAVAMGDIIMPQSETDQTFRRLLLERLAPFPGVHDYFLQMRFKPRPRHPRGLYLDLETQIFDGSLVGEMIPQPQITLGTKTALLDDLLGSGFALIAQDEAGSEAISAYPSNRLGGLPLGRVVLGFDQNPTTCAVSVTDPIIGRPLRTHRDQILLVRPDRYVAAAFSPADLASELARYRRMLKGEQVST